MPQFLTSDMIAMESLRLLRKNIVGVATFNQNVQPMFTGGEKVGDTVRLRRRSAGTVAEYGPSDSVSLTFTSPAETSVSVQLEKHMVIPIEITSRDMTLSLNDFSAQVLLPQINALVQAVDAYALTKFKEVPTVGGPSSSAPAALPASIADLALIDKALNDQMVPTDMRWHVVSSEAKQQIVSITNLTKVNEAGMGEALRRAAIGEVMGLNHAMTQGIDTATFTSGTMTSAVVNGALAAGATSIVFDGASGAAHTLKKYDILTIAGYGNVVVAADVTASSSAGTITIFDPLRSAVADNAAITVYDGGGNTRQLHGCAFHPDAFTFVSVPGEMPMGGAEGFVVTDGNLSMRVLHGFTHSSLKNTMTLDLICGAKLVDPRLACQTVKNI